MDEADMAKAKKEYPWTQTVAFRAQGFWSVFPESGRHAVHQGRSAAPLATLGSEHRRQQTIQNFGCNSELREMEMRQNGDEVRKARTTGTGVSIVQRHTYHRFREVRRSARGCDPGARLTRGCAAAVKGEVVVDVSDGHGQVARAREDRGFEAKIRASRWTRCGSSPSFALRRLVRKQRLLAVVINF